MGPSDGRIPAKRVIHRRELASPVARANAPSVARGSLATPLQLGYDRVRPLRDDEPAAAKEHEKVGGAIVVDVDPAKREAAKEAGAAHVVDGGAPNAAQQIVDLTQGGAWAVIDLVGSSQSARLGYDSLVKGGKYIIVGLYGGDLTVSLPPIPMRALTIQGSYVGSLPEMAELMELMRRTGPPQVPVATRPLDDVNVVMEQLRAGRVIGRVVLSP